MTAAPLSPEEIGQIENDLEITLDDATAAELAEIVKPDQPDAWHTNAAARIERIRKADLAIEVRDRWGHPIPGASVEVKLLHKQFHFGGILSRFHFPSSPDADDRRYQRLALKFFDASGLNNGLKLKLNPHGYYLPQFFEWNRTNGIAARGHLLIWPGNSGGSHLPANVAAIIREIYATAVTNDDGTVEYDPQLKADLRAASYDMITNWAARWPVYEWDVYNEPYGNHEIQEILDDYSIAGDWFRLARQYAVRSDCGLFINDNRMVSAQNARQYASRTKVYRRYIDELIASNTPITGIGFQARFKFDYAGQGGPQLITDRLDDFGNRYGLAMAGTEFHIPATDTFHPSDRRRAEMTEEIMTAFFSHPLVTGLNAWIFQSSDPNQGPLINGDWSVPLNGLVWYYLNRIKYSTHTNLTAAADGTAFVRGFKGQYRLLVRSGTNEFSSALALNEATNVVLSTSLPSPDSDADGIPDGYELLYPGLSPTNAADALLDSDGDGLCNRFEYATGSDPFAQPASPANRGFFLRALGSGRVLLHLARREGLVDQHQELVLEHSTNLTDWVEVDPADFTAVGYRLESASTNEHADIYGRITTEEYRLQTDLDRGYFRFRLRSIGSP